MGLNVVYMLPASNQTMGKSLNYMQVYSCYPKLKKQGKMLLPLEDRAFFWDTRACGYWGLVNIVLTNEKK